MIIRVKALVIHEEIVAISKHVSTRSQGKISNTEITEIQQKPDLHAFKKSTHCLGCFPGQKVKNEVEIALSILIG